MEKLKEIFLYGLASVITIGFFCVLAFVLTEAIPEANMDTANQVLGGLLVAFALVISFFYGSSKGSSDKNKFLEHNDK